MGKNAELFNVKPSGTYNNGKHAEAYFVQALCYKLEGRGFDFR
jgi:hypothetical protein